jgi:hypothetical protein
MKLFDILIALATGLISSAIVSYIYKKKIDKRDYDRQFEDDKQNLCTFIKHILDELMLFERKPDKSRLLWLLASEPR